MGRKIDTTIGIRIRVDETEWADEYGLAVGDVVEDIPGHLNSYVEDLVKHSGLGYLFEQVTTNRPRLRVEG